MTVIALWSHSICKVHDFLPVLLTEICRTLSWLTSNLPTLHTGGIISISLGANAFRGTSSLKLSPQITSLSSKVVCPPSFSQQKKTDIFKAKPWANFLVSPSSVLILKCLVLGLMSLIFCISEL
jgi:hypothetical protein